MNTFALYQCWNQVVGSLIPAACPTQLANLVWLMVGMYQGRSVQLALVARHLPLAAKKLSMERRFSRFLANGAVRVRQWYRPVAVYWVHHYSVMGEVQLIIDGSRVGGGHQLLLIALGTQHRALPIAWTWVRGKRGHSSGHTQLALLAYVRSLLPPGTSVLLVGDTEFGSVPVLQQLEHWGWHYVLRQASSTLVTAYHCRTWQPFGQIATRRATLWWAAARLTDCWRHHTNLIAHWAPKEDQPWLLATNLPDARTALQAYRRRNWIEQLFGDLKKHGVDLASTHLRHFARLSRLTLAAALLYTFLFHLGTRVIHNGRRAEVDRTDRRDLSIFRIGWDFLARHLARDKPLFFAFVPQALVSGS